MSQNQSTLWWESAKFSKASGLCPGPNWGLTAPTRPRAGKGPCCARLVLLRKTYPCPSFTFFVLRPDQFLFRCYGPVIWSTGTTSLTWQQQPLWKKNCVLYPGRSLLQGHMCHRMICARIAVSWEKRMLWSACGCSRGRRSFWTYDTYRWRANTRKWDTQLQRPGAENRRKKRGGLDGRHRLSSLGHGPTISPGGQGSAVI